MAQTAAIVKSILPEVLAQLVIEYFRSARRLPGPLELAELGEYERLMIGCRVEDDFSRSYRSEALHGAMRSNYIEIIREVANKYKCDISFSITLENAAFAGNAEVAQLLIDAEEKRCQCHSTSFAHSCNKGNMKEMRRHMKQINTMTAMEYRKNMWTLGFSMACIGGQAKVMRIMATLGARHCMFCKTDANEHQANDRRSHQFWGFGGWEYIFGKK